MTNSEPSARADDPKAILDQLRREIFELEDDTETLPEDDTDDERWANAHLRGIPIEYTGVATAAADKLMPRRELSDSARIGTVAAVRRELAERRRMTGVLPIVLRAVREREGVTLEDLARRSGLGEADLRDLESGATPVSRTLPPEKVAAWIRPLPVPRATAVSALRQSLFTTEADQPVLAAGLPDHPATADDYVAAVEAILDGPDRTDNA